MRKNFNECCECPFFKKENEENGMCQLRDVPISCDARCHFLQGSNELDEKQAEKILLYHQIWRRHNGKKPMKMVNGTLIGLAIDVALNALRKNLNKE